MGGRVDAVVVGAGHAGLSTSFYLKQQGREHVVLERGRVGETWRSRRWDSFTLVTPNWTLRLPGFPYRGADPDGFLKRDDVVAYLGAYAASFGAPVRRGVRVRSVEQDPDGAGYRVETDQGTYETPVVVVATGFYEQPRIPRMAADLPRDVLQIHSSQYGGPAKLPPGAVLVVGSGQSGCQIAEELHASGRRVYLCVGKAGRLPRRYRGKDGLFWADKTGFFETTAEQLADPGAKFAAQPHLSGKDGGHTINLHRFARDGITLLGRLQRVEGGTVRLAPDLHASLAQADQVAAKFKRDVDQYIRGAGIDAPAPDSGNSDDYDGEDGFRQEPVAELDLRAASVGTVVWACGYAPDYAWVRLPVFDADGYPRHTRGATAYPGLYFMGLRFQSQRKSDLFFGVGDDAAYVAGEIARSAWRPRAPSGSAGSR